MAFDFIESQAGAWQQIVGQMVEDAAFCIINGASVNGPGSSLEYTKGLREAMPQLLRKYDVTTMLDAPCGDWTWMRTIDLAFLYSYIGMDVDPSLIASNKINVGDLRPNCTFVRANLLKKKSFPKVDLILCRDFLAHLPNEYISLMLDKFKASGSKYLLASNYPGSNNLFSYDPETYESPWLGYLERPHDLRLNPFDLQQVDGITEQSPPGGIIAREHELGLFKLQR